MLFATLSGSAPKKAIPLVLVTEKSFDVWQKKQDKAVKGWIKTKSFKPKAGSFLELPGKDGGLRSVVVCLSEPVSLWDLAALPKALGAGAYKIEGRLAAKDEEKLAFGWLLGGYAFDAYKKVEKKKISLCVSKKINRTRVNKMAAAQARARDLITTRAEDLGPKELAQEVKKIAKAYGARVQEIVGKKLLEKNYPAVYAVGRASPRAPRLVDLRWGSPKHPKVTLVGKGVVFDTGGLDLKTGAGMVEMFKDMAGAATALAVAEMIMSTQLPVCLRLLLPLVENALSGNSYRPSDVIKMRDGQTVEVGNTDAEGRLVVADALVAASEDSPEYLIDFTTLGAGRMALGEDIAALYSDNDSVAQDILALGKLHEDWLCQFPLYQGYNRVLQSSVADVCSISRGGLSGAIAPALFLQRFVTKTQYWVHLDSYAYNRISLPGRPEGGEPMGLRAVFAMLEKRFAKA